MDSWRYSHCLWDEDDLENAIIEIKEKVKEMWDKGYDVDLDLELSFEEVSDG